MKFTYLNSILFISLIALLFFIWFLNKRSFDANIDILIDNQNTCTIECAIFDYYQTFGEVPDNMQVLFKYICQHDLYLMNASALIDPLSRTPRFLNYIPFKNSQNGVLDAYILLSVGIDARLDFKLIDQNNYDFYSITNSDFFYNESESIVDIGYSIWDQYFGNKDLIILKKNLSR
jgi:hypothetical protein